MVRGLITSQPQYMTDFKDIRDDGIRIVGQAAEQKPMFRPIWVWVVFACILGGLAIGAIVWWKNKNEEMAMVQLTTEAPSYFEPIEVKDSVEPQWEVSEVDSLLQGFTEVRDTLINDIPLRIFIPHNAEPSLCLGKIDNTDKGIVLAAQAADVRADNGGIVGAFVLKGEPLAWGLSKKGYCAIINGKITIGVANNSPLFEQATEEGGYFFRQSPLVKNGRLVENNPKGKSIRRGLCSMGDEVFVVESGTPESFHDFAQSLVDLGVNQAVYLVGSSAYGWALDEQGVRHELGEPYLYSGRFKIPKNTSYIVWRKKGE
jgi:hypothetical protein